jgi:anaerobic ribonucleoside-triphosphate reductase activating protein
MSNTASFTIWFSGCTIKCKDCHNRALWDRSFGDEYDVKSLFDIIKTSCNALNTNDVVFLGGEPLQQNKRELLYLCQLLHGVGLRIWLYTGYEIEEIERVDSDLMQYLYTIKCGMYIKELSQDGFPASSNQQVYRVYNNEWVNITSTIRRQ